MILKKIVNKLNKSFRINKYFLLIFKKQFVQREIKLLDKKILITDGKSFYYGYNEIFLAKLYEFNAKTDAPLIIDCGSNIGLSIIYFKKKYPKSKVIGFEADKNVFKILNQNLNRFNFEDVVIHNLALWNEITELKFFCNGSDGGRLEQTIIEENETQIVKTALLSEYLKYNEVDMLKIDIEGAETKVLMEAEKYLDNVNNIFVEYHSFSDEHQTLEDILRILRRNGFRYQIHEQFVSNKPFVEIINRDKMDMQLNIFGYR